MKTFVISADGTIRRACKGLKSYDADTCGKVVENLFPKLKKFKFNARPLGRDSQAHAWHFDSFKTECVVYHPDTEPSRNTLARLLALAGVETVEDHVWVVRGSVSVRSIHTKYSEAVSSLYNDDLKHRFNVQLIKIGTSLQ